VLEGARKLVDVGSKFRNIGPVFILSSLLRFRLELSQPILFSLYVLRFSAHFHQDKCRTLKQIFTRHRSELESFSSSSRALGFYSDLSFKLTWLSPPALISSTALSHFTEMSVTIRRATIADAPSLSHICLVTAEAGKSAESLHDFGELPGLVYAVPYVNLPTTWAFVLVDGSKDDLVVGYIVGSTDTRAYEKHAAEQWWPVQAEKYQPSAMVREGDKKYAALLRKMHTAPDANIAFSPAHMHINIVDGYRGQGWGRKMIQTAVDYLKGEGINRLWLGMDPRNTEARKFYERLGFTGFEGSAPADVGLIFE